MHFFSCSRDSADVRHSIAVVTMSKLDDIDEHAVTNVRLAFRLSSYPRRFETLESLTNHLLKGVKPYLSVEKNCTIGFCPVG